MYRDPRPPTEIHQQPPVLYIQAMMYAARQMRQQQKVNRIPRQYSDERVQKISNALTLSHSASRLTPDC